MAWCRMFVRLDAGAVAVRNVIVWASALNGKEQVVVRLLEGLGCGVELTLVGAAVVGLRLAPH